MSDPVWFLLQDRFVFFVLRHGRPVQDISLADWIALLSRAPGRGMQGRQHCDWLSSDFVLSSKQACLTAGIKGFFMVQGHAMARRKEAANTLEALKMQGIFSR